MKPPLCKRNFSTNQTMKSNPLSAHILHYLFMAIRNPTHRASARCLVRSALDNTAPPETKDRTGLENWQWNDRQRPCASNNSRAADHSLCIAHYLPVRQKNTAKVFIARNCPNANTGNVSNTDNANDRYGFGVWNTERLLD